MTDFLSTDDDIKIMSTDNYGVQIGKLTAMLDAAEAEVERLKAHTWQQERAAVVTWLMKKYEDREHVNVVRTVAKRFAGMIERGEHWPEGGKG